jgi:hypothetical protein
MRARTASAITCPRHATCPITNPDLQSWRVSSEALCTRLRSHTVSNHPKPFAHYVLTLDIRRTEHTTSRYEAATNAYISARAPESLHLTLLVIVTPITVHTMGYRITTSFAPSTQSSAIRKWYDPDAWHSRIEGSQHMRPSTELHRTGIYKVSGHTRVAQSRTSSRVIIALCCLVSTLHRRIAFPDI